MVSYKLGWLPVRFCAHVKYYFLLDWFVIHWLRDCSALVHCTVLTFDLFTREFAVIAATGASALIGCCNTYNSCHQKPVFAFAFINSNASSLQMDTNKVYRVKSLEIVFERPRSNRKQTIPPPGVPGICKSRACKGARCDNKPKIFSLIACRRTFSQMFAVSVCAANSTTTRASTRRPTCSIPGCCY